MCNKHEVIVGSGQSIAIHCYGQTNLSSPFPPLQLNNILHTPQLVKNWVSVRISRTDNTDLRGFSVMDFRTRRQVMRCKSRGEMYPITSLVISPSAFAALAPSFWHDRLYHP